MAKWYGKVGYAVTEETTPGVWTEKITERNYYGDIIKNTRRYQSGDSLNDNLNVSNEISIIADPFAYQNFHALRYVEFMGSLWQISNAEIVERPRIVLSIGGAYNG